MIETTVATTGTSLKNQSLRSSKTTLENLRRTMKQERLLEIVKNSYSSL